MGGSPEWKYNAYVALSWSRGQETIRLLCDFDDSLFTTYPLNELREQNARLERLDTETLKNYEVGLYNSWHL